MDIGSPLIAYPQTAHLAQPGQGAFDYPAVPTKAFARVFATPSNAYLDAPLRQCRATLLVVVAFVRMDLARSLAPSPTGLLDQGNGVDEFLKDDRVMPVGSGDHQRQRGAAPIYSAVSRRRQIALRACTTGAPLSAIRWVRAGVIPLFAAGMFWASTAARLQSSWSASPRRSSRTSWRRLQTPASFQGLVPVAQTTPASHATAASQFLGQHLPGDAALEHEQDAGEGGSVRYAGSAAARLGWFRRQQGLDEVPEFVGYKRFCHVDFNFSHPT